MKYEYTKGIANDFQDAIPLNMREGNFFDGRKYMHQNILFKDRETVYQNGYIIAERRLIPEPAWDGEGLPPVGVECELNSEEYADFDWVKVRIVFEHNGELIAIVNMPDEPIHDRMSKHSAGYDAAKFRPIRSPEDVAREKITLNMLQYMYSSDETDYAQVCKIYDAIAAGEIPGVKLE